jgi:4-alpha-glucanotransferase
MGVGEFLDLKGMIDWCVKSGFKLLQLLPITDTVSHVPATPQDSYPYSSISVYALHPQYLRLSDVEGLSAGLKAEIEKKVKEFNDPHYFREKQWDADLHIELNNPVDFPAMMNSKSDLLHKMFSEAGAKTFQTQNYK